MSPRGHRIRLTTGIYRDALGYAVVAQVGGHRREQRYPPGTSRATLAAARDALRTDLHRRPVRLPSATRDTFAADAQRYLAAVAGMPTYADRERLIAYWVEAFGPRARPTITAPAIAAQLAVWQRERRWSPRTVNHARTALMHLWHTLDGKAAPNPVRDVPAARLPAEVPREIPLMATAALVRAVRPGPVRSVLWLMVATGVTPTEVRRLTADSVRDGVLHVPGRRKGHGSAPRALPLSRHGRAACRSVTRTGAWGRVTLSALNQAWQHALLGCGATRGTGRGHPILAPGPYANSGWRVYDLRHTYLSQMGRVIRDERVLQYLAGHASILTTRRYTLGSVPDRVAEAARLVR